MTRLRIEETVVRTRVVTFDDDESGVYEREAAHRFTPRRMRSASFARATASITAAWWVGP